MLAPVTPITSRDRPYVRPRALRTKCASICSTALQSATTPLRIGHTAVMFAGVRPSMSCASVPIASILPRAVLNAHHRAQLGVYLRLNNEPVPSIYGPSADETLGF